MAAAEMQERWVLRPKAGDEQNALGWRIAVGGDTLLAGVPADSTTMPWAGSVYVFDTVTGQLVHELVPAYPIRQGYFGVSVAIEGTTALIGAPVQGAIPGIDLFEEVYDPGSAYIFDVQSGRELFKLRPDDSASLDYFGSRVAIRDNLAVVTAFGNDHAGEDSGAAYVFDVTTGRQLHKLTALDAAEGDHFGTDVSIDGDRVVIGATSDFAPGSSTGSAYVFDLHSGEQLHKLTVPDIQHLDYYARSVSASNGVALLGAHGYSFGRPGYVDVFDITTGEYIRRLKPLDGASFVGFGYATLLDDGLAMIGSSNRVDESGRRGAVYLFDINTGEQLDILTGPYFGEYDSFGFSLARDGDTTAIGVLDYDGNNLQSGVVHIYRDIPEPGALCIMAGGLGLMLAPGRAFRRARARFV